MGLERAIRMAYAPTEPSFVPPGEAPVFTPRASEFADPIAYVARIRAQAEPFGICKIRPPPGWRPPFALDVDRLRFSPRVQKLNELQGITRLRLHFEDRLCRFWELRARPLHEAPSVADAPLDLFSLYHCVRIEGGLDACDSQHKWPKVAAFLSHPVDANTCEALRAIYVKVLLPFKRALDDPPRRKPKPQPSAPDPPTLPDVKPVKLKTGSDFHASKKCSRELRRLASYGAGPKMAVPDAVKEDPDSTSLRKRCRLEYESSVCTVCDGDCKRDDFVTCAGCSDTYHPGCVRPPPLRSPPPPHWRCPPCVAEEIGKPVEPFGFAQAERTYSLDEFRDHADNFKAELFGTHPAHVPTALVEREFWRIVASADENVSVLYGADLHSMDHGSGFPTAASLDVHDADREYVESGWNLNNLPVLDDSVLNFITKAISGMTVPWMYVGMCFSSFCWHNEDHWSYSINYLHWGEPKTWYGVPGNGAPLLENAMKGIMPELFRSQPDLLHQLVTILNPNILAEAGVPICRTDQRPGEFVVTFPRSYHAGFNQGYNFAEAVNFAPPDWLTIGRDCILHYKNIKRLCVFSHDELICKIGLAAKNLRIGVAMSSYKEFTCMVEKETERRGALTVLGVKDASLQRFETMEDDRRLCEYCKTTCFLSALTCIKCKIMVCLDHIDKLCECPPVNYHLLYRYKLDELYKMINGIRERIQIYDRWMSEAKETLKPSTAVKVKVKVLPKLVEEANLLNIPSCKTLERLKSELVRITNVDPVVIEICD